MTASDEIHCECWCFMLPATRAVGSGRVITMIVFLTNCSIGRLCVGIGKFLSEPSNVTTDAVKIAAEFITSLVMCVLARDARNMLHSST